MTTAEQLALTAPSGPERWRPIPGFEHVYDVSDRGRVRRALDAPRCAATAPGRIRRVWVSSSTGYPETVLYKPGHRPIRRTIHSLVAEAFIGPCPPGCEVLHDDADRANPALANLHYGTKSENRRQAYADGRQVAGAAGQPGAANSAAKLTADDVREIRSTYEPGNRRHAKGNAAELADHYRVSTRTIVLAATGRTWRHLGPGTTP